MKRVLGLFFVLGTLLFSGCGNAAMQGNYTLLASPQPPLRNDGKIEVLEFFAYPCPHCHHLTPELNAWEKSMPKDVSLTYVPVVFRASWEPMAYTFYALEALGQRPQLHDALFDAWNVSHVELYDLEKITAFVSKHGVDGKKFGDAYRSFSVQNNVNRSKQLLRNYGIEGTPTLIVDGRYTITGLESRDMVRVLKDVIEQVRKERTSKKH